MSDATETEESLKHRQKQEAVERMMRLGVHSRIVRDYDSFGRIRLCGSPLGIYCELPKELEPAMRDELKQVTHLFVILFRLTAVYGNEIF